MPMPSITIPKSPLDCEPGTMPYLNAVMEINFAGPPVALLDRLLEMFDRE